MAKFQKTLGLFRYESGFFLPWGVHYRLSFRYKGKGYLLALGGPEAQPEVAQKYEEPIATVEILLETKLSRPLEINAREAALLIPLREKSI